MDATRTQLEAAANRFHYQRGVSDAMAMIDEASRLELILDCTLPVVAFLIGWFLAKSFNKKP